MSKIALTPSCLGTTCPLIAALGRPNGFTDTQIDDIFRAAMQV